MAVLEVLVHLDIEEFPDDYVLMRVSLPDASDAPEGRDARAVGDEWLGLGRTAVLRVPSVIVPHAWNLLLNPRHRQGGEGRGEEILPFAFDPRLWRP